MNCYTCRRAMVAHGNLYECRYCGFNGVVVANHTVRTAEPIRHTST